jgi:hypothetical protein
MADTEVPETGLHPARPIDPMELLERGAVDPLKTLIRLGVGSRICLDEGAVWIVATPEGKCGRRGERPWNRHEQQWNQREQSEASNDGSSS